MKKKLAALLGVLVLIAIVILTGEWFRRGQETEPSATQPDERLETQTALPAAASTLPTAAETETTQAPETTVPASVASTTVAPATTRAAATTLPASLGQRGTYTDRFPLPTVSFSAPDPENTRGLSTKRIDHSFGVPKNEQPNAISVNGQETLRKMGSKAVIYDANTQEKVLYLTFDCGFENGNTAHILDVLKEKQVPAAFFCTLHHIRQQPQLIARMIREGHIVGNHSNTHPDFSSISRTKMAKELEDVENELRTKFGYSSTYFRFPEGAYSESALDLVDSLGFTSVFWSSAYADWDTSNPKGADYAYRTVTSRLHPGAVILLHAVSPDNAAAMADIIDTARDMGYTFRSLDEIR